MCYPFTETKAQMQLEKYSIGMGDRFGREGAAQMQAILAAKHHGIDITPVWNKSNREHSIVGTTPGDVRLEADNAVQASGWTGSYRVDADHIGMATVDKFIAASDFFTLDVADFIGRSVSDAELDAFRQSLSAFIGALTIPGIAAPFSVTDDLIRAIGTQYCAAIQEAGKIYRHILGAKGEGAFIVEVSLDETDKPQSPLELFFIMGALASEGIPMQTIAPKFVGEFHKGVDYIGDPDVFAREFEAHVLVVAHAIRTFRLPANLKLSVHSGSDKFSLYPAMRVILAKHDAGIHVKTAGTTWLEEVIGLAAAGGEGLKAAKEIYAASFKRYDELCGPYLSVIDIDRAKLPLPATVEGWSGMEYVRALQHDQSCRDFSVHFRQLVHVGYKVAAEMGARFQGLLGECRTTIE
ncbi:MAG: tagaturonate epimerase family protein, partial [Verrucomicrobiota bacterium]